MKALSNKQQVAIQEQIVRQLGFSCLPLLLALVLLCWLSLGLPHPTWFLLLKTIFQAGTLISMQGMAFLLPLIILSIQSIFLLTAWGLLIWGITREVKALLALYSELSMPVSSVGAAAPVPQQATATPASQQAIFAPAVLNPYTPPPPPPAQYNPFDAEEDDIPTQITISPDYDPFSSPSINEPISGSPHAWEDTGTETVRSSASNGRKEHKPVEEVEGSLYEYEKESDDSETELPQKRPSTAIQRRSALPPGRPEPRRVTDAPLNRPKRLPEPERWQKASYTPISPVEEDPLDATEISDRPKANKARNTGEFKQMPADEVPAPSTPTSSDTKKREKRAAAPPPPQDDPFAVVEDDPFAVKADVMNVFEEEPAQEEEGQESSDGDAVFVFGNPFEGPLPDVFMEDEDLKRSVMEQQAGLSEDTSPQRAVKKPGQKPTGIRKRSSSN